jgi:DNA-binding LacI/PurR family transcriptional regulator
MVDIARLAGVHVSTVSRALAGSPLVDPRQRARIFKLARQQNYAVNSTARNLRLRHTQTIDVVIPVAPPSPHPLTDAFVLRLIGHLAEAITERGYSMSLRKLAPTTRQGLPNLTAASHTDGIIVIGQSAGHEALQRLATGLQPLVVWGARIKGQTYCTVGTDNFGGGLAATEHLLKSGRRRILFMGDPRPPAVRLRYAGYVRALSHGPAGTGRPRILRAPRIADEAYESMRAFLQSNAHFDAVFAASDVGAISAMHALQEAGVSIPQDVAVVGFDDIPIAPHTSPPLTTVRQDVVRAARILVDLLLRRIAGEDTASVLIPAELVVRESSSSRFAETLADSRGSAA